MKQTDFSKRILVSITGHKDIDWKSKLKEVNGFGISKVALFLECFSKSERQKIYHALLESKIKQIPLVHIRNDMDKKELIFLAKNFGSSYFTIHEDSFKVLNKWKSFYKHLFLEMNTDNFVSQAVKVSKIGGFCIDLAHFKVEEEKWSKEFEYITKRRRISKFFACNHLNGYSPEKNTDLHTIKSLKDFDYLKTMPKFLFGNVIGIETENSISEQLKFKKYLVKLLNKLLNR